jgi:hypothetical protein
MLVEMQKKSNSIPQKTKFLHVHIFIFVNYNNYCTNTLISYWWIIIIKYIKFFNKIEHKINIITCFNVLPELLHGI